jgi:colicin import membrane protein
MANTRLSSPVIVTSNSDPKPSNVVSTPANGSDGTYTWACVGQKDTGSTSIITFSVTGTASSPQIVAKTTNQISATCQVKAATTNYVQVTAAFTSPSNSTNWTIVISGGGTINNVRFARGTGGGGGKKPVLKAAAVRVAKPAAKKATKKAVKKATKKAVKKATKKAAKKATKPAKKAAPRTARKKAAAKRRK